MRGLNSIILNCTHIMLQCWYFAIPASAFNPFDLGEDPGLCGVAYHKDWYIPPGSTEPSSKDHLMKYLDRTLEDRKNSSPFFQCPHPSELPTESLKLMNSMLKSKVEDWPEYIQEIFKTEPSVTIKHFWGFIYELSDFMTTPVLQKTIFIVQKEEKRLQRLNVETWYKAFPDVVIRYEDKMREHIELLEHENKPKCIIDIFKKDDQERLGEYGIQLEAKWSPNDQVELYKAWGSHMRLYMSVQGIVKEILEYQAIQIIWLTKGTFNAWNEMQVMVENSLKEDYQNLTYELVKSLKSLDNECQLCYCQRSNPYGIFDLKYEWAFIFELDAIIFWVKYMPFYLQMISSNDTRKYQFIMTKLIYKIKGDQLESIMQQFMNNPPPSKGYGNVIVSFLEFVAENSDNEQLKKESTRGLEYISEMW
ncbi:hypothetical protein DFH28DRAFT_1080836 [Melampsora americana]|nr:hypothetical protein DFH28DRAFT_1080836 [Melampsora americana]